MLLHVFVGDGQLIKPPEDLKTLRLTVSTSAGFGKGGREFDVGNNWTEGSFVRFHSTLVVGEVDDPGCSKLTFELKGCYKKDPAREVVLGTAAIETKKKAKTYVLDLAPSSHITSFFGGGKDERVDSICKLSITLYHNRFPVDLSPDEVALRHKREMLASKELKQNTKPSAREYSFLLNRKMNWDSDDAASFNKDTEKQLDKDVVSNLKDMYRTKQKEKAAARDNAARGRQRLRAPFRDSEPALAYGSNKHKQAAYVDISPHRPTALGVGYVGVGATPRSPPRQGKGTILYKKSEASEDPLEDMYNKMVMAEKRRLLKTNQKVKKAHFQTSLDRAKAQIIAQKAKESREKDEMLRRMMEKSDAQLKELRDEINRRKRRIAYLGLQKHISEAEARKRKQEEEVAKAKAEERAKLESVAKRAMRETRSLSPRRSSMNDYPSWSVAKRSSSAQPGNRPAMPVGQNAIPLRRAPDGTALKLSREARALREKARTRIELEEETAVALLEAHRGPAGAHAENSFSRSASPARPPMPIERNRLPLRKAESVSARARALQYKRKQEQERRAMALAAAEAAHDRLVAKLKGQGRASGLPVEGVIQHNPFPLREVPPGGNLASAQKGTPKGKVYDFSKIGSAAKEQLESGGSLDLGEEAEIGLGSTRTHRPPLSKTGTPATRVRGTPTNLYTFTMPDGTTLTSKSLSELERKIADAKRAIEAQRTRGVLKKKVAAQSRFSATVSKRTGRARNGKKYATPVDQTKKYKKFYSPDYKAPDNSSAEETARLVSEFESSVDVYQKKAEAAIAKTERRTEGIAMTAEAVGGYDKLAAKGDALLAGEAGPQPTEVPGFLSEYTEKGHEVPEKKKKHGTKGGKKHHEEHVEEPVAAAASPASEDMAALKKQLESQGVKVDEKMLEIMKSLQTEAKEGKAASNSPDPKKKSDVMSEIESALYRDEEKDVPTWGSRKNK